MKNRLSIRNRFRRGATLIEQMVAASILVVGVMGVVGASSWVARATDFNNRTTRAALLAQDKLEELLTLGPAKMSAGQDERDGVSRVWTIEQAGSCKAISVKVGWQGMEGARRSFTVSTMVSTT